MLFDDQIELRGNTDLFVDPCKRLLECCDMLVQLETAHHRVAVWGHDLSASDYSRSGLHIHGTIAAVELDGGLS